MATILSRPQCVKCLSNCDYDGQQLYICYANAVEILIYVDFMSEDTLKQMCCWENMSAST